MYIYIAPIYFYDYKFAEFFIGFEQIISPVDPNMLQKKVCHKTSDYLKTSIMCSCMVWATINSVMALLSSIQSVGFEFIGSTSTTVSLYIGHGHGCRPHLGNCRLIDKGIIENPASSFSPVMTLEASCFRYFAIEIFCKLRKMKGCQESEIKTIAHVQLYS